MRGTKSRIWACAGALALLVGGCGGDDEKKTGTTSAALCDGSQTDLSKIGEQRCVRDDDCGCGAFCDLGVCAYECTSSSDCAADQRCDLHGRCRAATDPGNVAPAPLFSVGAFEVVSPLVSVGDVGEPHVFDVRVTDTAVPRMRLVADPGVQISCNGPDGDFGSQCVMSDVEPGRHRFWVKPDGELPEEEQAASVRVFSHRNMGSVGVRLNRPQDSTPTFDKTGRYRGVATFGALGARANAVDLVQPLQGVSLPVEATVTEAGSDEYGVEIADPLHLFGADPSLILRVSRNGDGWEVEGRTRRYLEATADHEPDVVVTHSCSANFEGALELDCTFELDGVHAGDARGIVGVSFELSRYAELPDDAAVPPLPSNVSPAAPADDRAATALAWEAAVSAALSQPFGPASESLSATAARMATLDGSRGLWQCEAKEGALEHACTKFWSAQAPTLVGTPNFPCTSNPPSAATGAVPCRVEVTGNVVDECDTMQATFGCEPGVDATPRFCIFPDAQRATPLASDVAVNQCPQLYMCWNPPDSAPSQSSLEPLGSVGLSSNPAQTLRTLGDFSCDGSPFAFATDFTATPDLDEELRPSTRDLLEACAQDLERYTDGPADASLQNAPALLALSGSAGCLEPWRIETALARAFGIERDRALGLGGVSQGVGATLGLRLLFQWSEVLGFVAREALESDTLAAVLTADAAPIEGNQRPLDEYLQLSLDGWALLLHPRIAAGLLQIPGAVLAEPDYRVRLSGAPLASTPPLHHSQGVGLPVVLAETLDSQLAAARQLVSRARFTGAGSEVAQERAASTIRYTLVVLGVADALARRASALTPSWWSRWEAARGLAQSGLSALLNELSALQQGLNPLGIDDAALPLYFFGDEDTASRRFSAVSDFLLGTTVSMTSQAWAPAAVTRAQASLEAARAEWLATRERELAATIATTDANRRLENIASSFGERIINLCGVYDWSASSILEEWTGTGIYTPQTCFMDTSAECAGQLTADPSDQVYDAVTEADVALTLCVAAGMRRTFGRSNGHPLADAAINRALDAVGWNVQPTSGAPKAPKVDVVAGPGSGSSREFSVGPLKFPVGQLYQLEYPGADPEALGKAVAACADSNRGSTGLPSAADVLGTNADPNCYLGSLGDAYQQIVSAVREIQLAREELAAIAENYDIAFSSCQILSTNTDTINELEEVRNNVVTGLRAAKLVADIVQLSLSTVAEAGSWDPLKSLTKGVAATGVIVSGSISLGLEFAIETNTAYFDQAISRLERETAVDQCFNDARQSLVGAKAAALRLEKAEFDVRSAIANFTGLQLGLEQIIREGQAILENERARIAAVAGARRPLANDRWVNESVERFRREFRFAQRLTYLAVRAVEYEYQMSLSQRGAVLAALHPAQLRQVLDELLMQAGTRRVNGNAPTELVTVVSLKQQLLQLSDRAGYKKELRFADYLASRKVFDATGKYVGIEVPFRLVPESGVAAVGNTVSVFAPGDCAERLWSVSASVVGREGQDLWRGSDAPSFVRIDLQKANSFFSRWCTPGDTEYQVASVFPAVNLFVDPALGRPAGIEDSSADPANSYTSARMRAFFNVPRSELESDEYSEGESAELAARGLYGDYRIFIPADVLSRDGSDGLFLDAVDDILLRLEYVSVAR